MRILLVFRRAYIFAFIGYGGACHRNPGEEDREQRELFPRKVSERFDAMGKINDMEVKLTFFTYRDLRPSR